MQAGPAVPQDAEAVARIYNGGIEERIATFEARARTAGEVRSWFGGRHPVVVVEEDGDVLAFGAASEYRSRQCYASVAEFSVYADGGARRRGAGLMAVEALILAAEQAGLWKLVSRVFVENAPSRRLLRSSGFREVGVYERHAKLDGAWRDVVIVEGLPPNP